MKSFCLIFLLSAFFLCQGQTPITWTNYTNTSQVSGIVTGADGRIWISRYTGGVSVLSGSTWTTYTKENSGLVDNRVTCIGIDAVGNVWAGTEGFGLCRFDGQQWTTYTKADGNLPDDFVYSVAFTSGGKAVAAGTGNGFCVFDGNKWKTVNYLTVKTFPESSVVSLAIDSSGVYWLATNDRLYTWDGDTLIKQTTNTSGDNISCVSIDKKNTVWVGYFQKMAKYDHQKWTYYSNVLPAAYILSIHVDKVGTKWIGTDRAGLYRFNDTLFTPYSNSNSPLLDNTVYSVRSDSANRLWIGTEGGLNVRGASSWQAHFPREGLASNIVYDIEIDAKGNAWCGTFKGLSKFDGHVWTTYTSMNSALPSNMIQAVAIGSDQKKYIGTDKNGVMVFDDISWTSIRNYDYGLTPLINIQDILLDSKGNKWFATAGYGVSKYDGFNWTGYTTSTSDIEFNAVTVLAEDPKKNIWCGSGNYLAANGVSVFDGKSWQTPLDQSIKNVFSIAFENDSTGWFGSMQGVFCSNYPLDCARPYLNPLGFEPNVYSIAIDDHNTKWFGTSAGLTKFLSKNDHTSLTIQNSPLAHTNVRCLKTGTDGSIWAGTDAGISVLNKPIVNSIEESKVERNVRAAISPNPAAGILNVQTSQAPCELSIWTMDGKQLETEVAVNTSHQLDISGLSKGIYLLKVAFPDVTKFIRIIKE